MIRITVEMEAYSNYWSEVSHPATKIIREYDTSDLHLAKQWFLENVPFGEAHLVRAMWEYV